MTVTIYHPVTGGTAQIHERTLPGWQSAGWSTTPPKAKRRRTTRKPKTTPSAADGVQDDSTAGASTEPTKE